MQVYNLYDLLLHIYNDKDLTIKQRNELRSYASNLFFANLSHNFDVATEVYEKYKEIKNVK